ncbi:PLP-dependent aminotransferase family protein [Pseudonocardiaceae bacterium YIM PH 21723]|nr:PLP-dependent aminotransferase family protein [Pseudonocardiaceae bacterium YIM PH 21723]
MTDAGLVNVNGHTLGHRLGDWSQGPGPAHRRLADRIRLLILDGRLPLATTMPGERDVATALGISRTTVSTAYATLRDGGYLSARDRTRSQTRLPTGTGEPDRMVGGDLVEFSFAAPAIPGPALRQAFTRALDQLPRYMPLHGYHQVGLPELRSAVARRFTERGLPTDPGQILITNGAQHALALIARTLLGPGDRVVVDHPTYPHTLTLFHSLRCRITPVPLAEHGWDLDSLATATRGAALASLIPDFHNPTGLLMAAEDRERLRVHCPLVVDETMAELALDAPPPVPVPGAIIVGSMAKTFWGGLRVGWVRADQALIHRLVHSRPANDLGTPVMEQLASVELLTEIEHILPGHLDTLRAQRARLLDLVADRLPDWIAPRPAGGLAVWARLPGAFSSALAVAAEDHGVRLAAGPRFGIGGAFERFMRLPYSLDVAQLERGIDGIASAVRAVGARRRDRDAFTPMA